MRDRLACAAAGHVCAREFEHHGDGGRVVGPKDLYFVDRQTRRTNCCPSRRADGGLVRIGHARCGNRALVDVGPTCWEAGTVVGA